MSVVKITYNPYMLETNLVINDEAITDGELHSITHNKRMDLWIESILTHIAKRLNEKNFTLLFQGIKQDFEDLREQAERFNQRENGNISIEALPGMEKNSPLSKLAELRALADEAESSTVEGLAQTAAISHLRKVLEDTQFEICVVATMSSGKSTLINALLGRDLLPAANEATTAAITRITNNQNTEDFYGNAYDHEHTPFLREDIMVDREKVSAWNSDERAASIELYGPVPMARTNGQGSSQEQLQLVLVDTPGPNSVVTLHKETTYKNIEEKTPPLILFIIDCTNDLTSDTNTLLFDIAKQMKTGGKRIKDRFLFVANKIDALDTDREDIGKTLDKFSRYLKDHEIENSRILPLCSVLPKLIRWSQAGGVLTKDEKRRLHHLQDAFIEDDEKDLLQYITPPGAETRVTVSPSVAAEINRQVAKSIGSGNTEELAVLRSGLVTLEESIKEYVQKYGVTEKINTAKEVFCQALQIDAVQKDVLKKLQSNKEELEQLNILLERIQHKVKTGEAASAFKKRLQGMSFEATDEYQNKLNATRTEYYTHIDRLMVKIPQEEVAENVGTTLINIIKNEFKSAEEKMRTDFNAILNSVLKNQAEKICTDYDFFYKEFFENASEVQHILQNISFDIHITLSSVMRSIEYYATTKREKVGTREVSDATWWNPFSWFSTRPEGIYEDKSMINMKAVSQDVQSRMRAEFEKKQEEIEIDFESRIKMLSADIARKMSAIDDKVQAMVNEMRQATQSKEAAEQTMVRLREQEKWLNDFTQRLNRCLALHKGELA